MLVAKRSTSWQATPKQQDNRDSAADDERRAPQPADGDAIGTKPEPDAGKPHQLLTTHSNSRQHRRDLDCLLYTSPSPRDGLLSRMPSSA